MMATLSVSWRSMSSGRVALSSASAREVVQRPVVRLERHLPLVLLQELLLRRQKARPDEPEDGSLDPAALLERLVHRVSVGADEILLAPREDRAGVHLVLLPVDLDAFRPGGALPGDIGELRFELLGRERLAAEPATSDRAAGDREIDARVVKAGEDGMLDLL